MNKISRGRAVLLLTISVFFVIGGACAASASNVDVVVVGMISHGPMQPTVRAIQEVTGKYGDRVQVTWVDMSTQEGTQYARDHGITAHLTIFINGKDHAVVNGTDVTFQWLLGQGWTKEDLDTALAAALASGGETSAGTQAPATSTTRGAPLDPAIAVFGIFVGGIATVLLNRREK